MTHFTTLLYAPTLTELEAKLDKARKVLAKFKVEFTTNEPYNAGRKARISFDTRDLSLIHI